MDKRNINDVFVPKNCTRTVGADTIDLLAVTGVQIKASKNDAGVAATTFFGPGEVVITDAYGLVLDATTALKSVPSIKIHAREYNGVGVHGSKEIRGKDITGYRINPYLAPQECMVGISGIDASLTEYDYILNIELEPTNARTDYVYDKRITVAYTSGTTASTEAEIYAGLALEINKYFGENAYNDITLKATAAATGLLIEAVENDWDLESFKFSQTRFKVSSTAEATIVTNLHGDVTFLTVAYPKATRGAGHYKIVAEEEYQSQPFRGVSRNQGLPEKMRRTMPLSAQEFETDGITANKYDELIINWEYTHNHTLTGTMQQGTIHIFLPVEDNGTSQVGSATGIVPVLDKYIATEWGVSSAQIGNLS